MGKCSIYCSEDPATFLHVFWECLVIRPFWVKISTCIRSVMTVSVPLSIDVYILGLVHLLATSGAMSTLLGLLLFYTCKTMLLNWKAPQAPTLDFWKSIVNKMMPLYKFTYESRGCPTKFSMVWEIWTNFKETVASVTVLL